MNRWIGRLSALVASAALVGLLGACGGGATGGSEDGSTGSSEDGSPSAGEFLIQRASLRAEVDCRASHEQCEGKPPGDRDETSPEGCYDAIVSDWESPGEVDEEFGGRPKLLRALEAGTVAYDAEAAADCLAKLRGYVGELSCIQARRLQSLVVRGIVERELISTCPDVFTARAELGDECAVAEECSGDLVCRREEGEGCGVCVDPDQVGTSGQGGGFRFALEGEGCGSPNHSPTCDPTSPLVCSRSGEGSGWTCLPERSRSEGEACGSFGACEDGLVCVGETCESFEIVAEGESCESESNYCDPPRVCRATGTGESACADPGGEGDACRRNESCREGLWCDREPFGQEAGECASPLEEGEDCGAGEPCASGLRCIYSRGEGQVCQPPLAEGEECFAQGSCREGLVCEFGGRDQTCQPREGEVQTNDDAQCRGGGE